MQLRTQARIKAYCGNLCEFNYVQKHSTETMILFQFSEPFTSYDISFHSVGMITITGSMFVGLIALLISYVPGCPTKYPSILPLSSQSISE